MFKGFVCYVIDTETTGLDPVENDVIEVSACRVLYDEGEVTQEQKTWCIKAMNPKTIQDEALKINGHKREDILHMTQFGKDNYLLPDKAVAEMESWILDDNVSAIDRVFAGQNPNFDIQALQELWKKVGSLNTFPFALERGNRIIDTKQIAIFIDLCTGRRRQYYNLSSLVKAFGVKKGKAHRASEDTIMTTNLLIAMMNPVRAIIAESFKDCYPSEE